MNSAKYPQSSHLKLGFARYVSGVRIEKNKALLFALESVTIHEPMPPAKPDDSILQKARIYTHNFLYQSQENFRKAKKQWLEEARQSQLVK